MNTEKSKIYTMFLPCYLSIKDRLLNKLKDKCKDVDFLGFDDLAGSMDTEGRTRAYRKIRNLKNELNGIIVFGSYLDYKITDIGLPVIMVRALLGIGEWQKGMISFYKNRKILTACLSNVDISSLFSSLRFDDLLHKVRLIVALKKVKESRLLCIQEQDILGSYDVSGMDFHIPLPEDYKEVYSNNLKEIGLDVVHASLTELNKEIEKVKEKEAERIADMWISQAKEVTEETDKGEVLKAAKMYLGVKEMMLKYGATGIAIRSLVPWMRKMLNVTPCLVIAELNKQLKVGVCEGLVNNAITQMFGIYIANRPSFVGDVIGIDTINEVVTFAHCQAPINPHGNDKVPYIIRSFVHTSMAGLSPGAVLKVELPIDETITVTKFSLYHKKIAISSGITVPGGKFYKDFDNIGCRTKVVMQTNAEAFERNYDTHTFGVHRNIIYGDYRKEIKNLATLIGLEVVEEDKS